MEKLVITGWDELLPMFGRCRAVIDRWIKLKGFPKPVKIGMKGWGTNTWVRSEVEAWRLANPDIVNKQSNHKPKEGTEKWVKARM